MDLWNEYEGKVIAGSFPLEKLLRPQGRSAFFSTSNGTGTPAVIRLLEALNDEQEILARWRVVAGMNEANLVAIRKCGEAEVDGTPLIYAVMEPTDANLAEVLSERPLTVEETRQLAASLVPALQALHAHDLVHEHIEPANVFAAGEVIKLRSDCIRDVPAGPEGDDLKARDVQDLAALLHQALTQRKQRNSGTLPLPAPFEEIVRNGTTGAWGLREIAAALALPPAAPLRREAAAPAVAAKAPEFRRVSAPAPVPEVKPVPEPVLQVKPAPEVKPVPSVPSRAAERTAEHPADADPRRTAKLIAGAVALLVLLLIALHFFRNAPATQPNAAVQGTSGAPSTPIVVPAQPPNDTSQRANKPSAVAVQSQSTKPEGRRDWRVVAFTYNHASQAQQKVKTIEKSHASLKPEVFTPNGLPPYLVTLGGAMSHDEALALRAKAHAAGLPRDTYVQNYSGKTR